jgi:hypothetical protein
MGAAFTAGAGRRAWQRGRRLPALKHASAPGRVSPPSAHRRAARPFRPEGEPAVVPFSGRASRPRGLSSPPPPDGSAAEPLLVALLALLAADSGPPCSPPPPAGSRGAISFVPGLSPSGARVRVAPTHPHGGRDRARIASPPGASPVCGSSAHVRRLWSEDRGGLAARLPRGVPAGHLPRVQMRARSRRFTPFRCSRAGFRVGRVRAWPCQVRVGNLEVRGRAV